MSDQAAAATETVSNAESATAVEAAPNDSVNEVVPPTSDESVSAESVVAVEMTNESSDPAAAVERYSSDTTPSDATPSDSQRPSDATPSDATPSDATPSDQMGESLLPNTAAATNEGVQVEAKENTAKKAKPTKPKSPKSKDAAAKKKKISPRQRRRRWLVSVLKPLAGKRFPASKLSSFQIVMLGRALRSQVAECAFEYDATKLVAELQRITGGFNRVHAQKLEAIVLEHEANIREAAEGAWWNEMHERASERLADVAADHLRRYVNRGPVDAKVVMSIDAVGPRTAATAIVAADGRVLHCEDIPCQLSAAQRTQAVTKMGELIHTYHVDLIVISNGPARRASMIAVNELIKQSPEKSIRWTMADRGGADAYASSPVADQEMRKTSRRFRGAAWLAFSVLQPAQAFAKVDPLKLRLASFQRELAEESLYEKMEHILISGASRGGVDANQAPQSWLQRLPGMTAEAAAAIDQRRREQRFSSRDDILELDVWNDVVHSRQAIPFLRVFGGEEPLDGTLIHPDDYVLAKKLAKVLGIELPPASPPGYEPQDLTEPDTSASAVSGLAEATPAPQPREVEEFTTTGSDEQSFAEDLVEASSEATEVSDTNAAELVASEDKATTDESTVDDATSSPDHENPEPIESPPDEEMPSEEEKQADVPVAESAGDTPASTSEQSKSVKQPRPEQAKIDKCVKEWQVGTRA